MRGRCGNAAPTAGFFALRCREARHQRSERVPDGLVGERAAAAVGLLDQPTDEIGHTARRDVAEHQRAREVAQRVLVEQAPVFRAGLLPETAAAGALVAVDPLPGVVVKRDA
jgi:hypothetical protein